MTSMCVMCYVCLNWHFTEIKVQRESRSRCKQERSQRLKTDNELFALPSDHYVSCLCLMARARQQSTIPLHRPTSLFILVYLFCLTFFFWSWELCTFGRCDQTRQPKILLKDKIFRELFLFFVLNLFRCVHTVTHIVDIEAFRDFFALRSCVPLRSRSALFLTSTDNSFPLYPTFRGHSPQHTLLSLPTHPSLVELSPFCTRSVPIKADSPSAACPANTSQR